MASTNRFEAAKLLKQMLAADCTVAAVARAVHRSTPHVRNAMRAYVDMLEVAARNGTEPDPARFQRYYANRKGSEQSSYLAMQEASERKRQEAELAAVARQGRAPAGERPKGADQDQNPGSGNSGESETEVPAHVMGKQAVDPCKHAADQAADAAGAGAP